MGANLGQLAVTVCTNSHRHASDDRVDLGGGRCEFVLEMSYVEASSRELRFLLPTRGDVLKALAMHGRKPFSIRERQCDNCLIQDLLKEVGGR